MSILGLYGQDLLLARQQDGWERDMLPCEASRMLMHRCVGQRQAPTRPMATRNVTESSLPPLTRLAALLATPDASERMLFFFSCRVSLYLDSFFGYEAIS